MLWRLQEAMYTSGGLIMIHVRIVILMNYILFMTMILRGGLWGMGPVRNKEPTLITMNAVKKL